MMSFLTVLTALFALPGDFDIIINEIHYHPFGNDGRDEFIEIYNRGPVEVDLSGWRLEGAVVFLFPSKLALRGGEYLVVSPDPQRTVQRYGVPPKLVMGPWAGQLDNDGDTLQLKSAEGTSIARVRYRDGGGWPAAPDGFGPTLELVSPRYDFDFPEKWAASLQPGGTPGYLNSRWFSYETVREYLILPADPVRYFRGLAEVTPAEPLAWTRPDYETGEGWEDGPGPIGYGEPDIGTVLDDMLGAYTSVYLRASFQLDERDLALLASGTLSILATVRYDDGFAAYIDGLEVFRFNVPGNAGEPIPFDEVALGSGEASISFDLAPGAERLRKGTNFLCLHGFNRHIDQSSDFFLGITLLKVEHTLVEEGKAPGPVINEVAAGGPGAGFIEIMNPTSGSLNLGGFRITWDPYPPGAGYSLPSGTILPAGGLLAFDAAILNFTIPQEEARYILLDSEGNFVAGLDALLGPLVSSWGLYPDGGGEGFALAGASKGTANRIELQDAVVINEIHYHPRIHPDDPEKAAQEEFIELYNWSDDDVDLTGWRFTRGLNYAFTDDLKIPPRGYLVVAGVPSVIRELYTLPEEAVVGGFPSRLTNDAETLRLEDQFGNPVDQVRYADDGSWPPEADGEGPSLELAHPRLANETGSSWRAGPPGGTPGAQNQALDPEAAPVVFGVRHDPPVPQIGQPIRVVARAGAVGSVTRVFLTYQTEHGAGSGQIELSDDGISGDGQAGDGIWGGTIPPPVPDGPSRPARVVFSITAEDDADHRTTVPEGGRSFLFEVDDQEFTGNSQPRYRLIMTDANWQELRSRSRGSNVLLDATFIGDGEIFYNAGLRYRGQSARSPPDGRFSYRINLTEERRFHGIRKLNLNAQGIWRQMLGNEFIRRAGIPAIHFWLVNVWIDGVLDRGYLRVEALDGDFIDRNFSPADRDGNLYRGQRGGDGRQGNLFYYGGDPALYTDTYDKITNQEEADWSDVIHLCDILTNTPEEEYVAAVRAEVDVEEWCRYFAIYSALGSTETGLYRDDGDDYFLYRRSGDGRWMLFPWDHDSDFRQSEIDQVLFRPSPTRLSSVYRFLTHPEFAPIYYCILEELVEGPFSRRSMENRFHLISDVGGESAISEAQNYVVRRLEFFGRNIPAQLTAGVTATGSSSLEEILVDSGDIFTYFEGTENPPPNWMDPGFDDAGWPSGPAPFGSGYDPLGTPVGNQFNYLILFARRTFQVPDASGINELSLIMGYDDGFAAYLNGTEVARSNLKAPGEPVLADDNADSNHDGYPRELFPVDHNLIQKGKNVLAVVIANNRIGSSDFLLDATLVTGIPPEEVPGGGCGETLQGAGGAVQLEGIVPGCLTRSVRVNGQPAEVSPVGARWEAQVELTPGLNPVQVEALDEAGDPIATLDLIIEEGNQFHWTEGTLDVGAHWTKGDGPYYVSGNLQVPAGARLTIDPGCIVMVAPDAMITIRGELSAGGTPEEPILFQPVHCGETWAGIQILDTGLDAGAPVHRLGNAVLDRAGTGDGAAAALLVQAARVEVQGVTFQDMEGIAVYLDGAQALVEDSRFREVPGALYAMDSSVTLRRSDIFQTPAGMPAVLLEGDGLETSFLEKLSVISSVYVGVALRNSSAVVAECKIQDSSAGALYVEGGSPQFSHLILCRSGTGILAQGGTILGDHLTITENFLGIHGRGGAQVTITSSIVWGNSFEARADGATIAFSYSDSDQGSGEPPPGPGNIAADPLFKSLETYELAAGSPAAGAGKDGTDMGAVSSPQDGPTFIRGNYKDDGAIDLTDVIVLLGFMFLGDTPQRCDDAGDTDDNGILELTDAIYLLSFMFTGGAAPPLPYPDPGPDPTPDSLNCK